MITPSYTKSGTTSPDSRRELEGIERDLRHAREHVDDTGDPAAARAALKLARRTASAVKANTFTLAPTDRGRILQSLDTWTQHFASKLHEAESTAPPSPSPGGHSEAAGPPEWLRRRWALNNAAIRYGNAEESRTGRTAKQPNYHMRLQT